MDRSKFKSMIAFLDMLWILLAGFGAMFIIAYLLIQPPAKNADIIKKAEYIINLVWDENVGHDIDLWVMDPNGNVVSFRGKTAGFMNLEKDDVGTQNDTITDEYGNATTLRINEETVTLRGTVPGEYQVMIHVYSRGVGTKTDPKDFYVEVIKVNPYKNVYRHSGVYGARGQRISIVRFTVGPDDKFIGFNNHPSDIIKFSQISASLAGITSSITDETPL